MRQKPVYYTTKDQNCDPSEHHGVTHPTSESLRTRTCTVSLTSSSCPSWLHHRKELTWNALHYPWLVCEQPECDTREVRARRLVCHGCGRIDVMRGRDHYRSPYRTEATMTVSHCSVFAYTRRAISSSRASPHNLLHSPWLCLRAKLSVHVSHCATRGQMASISPVHKAAMNELELLKLAHGRIVLLQYRVSFHTPSYRSGTSCACQLLRSA